MKAAKLEPDTSGKHWDRRYIYDTSNRNLMYINLAVLGHLLVLYVS